MNKVSTALMRQNSLFSDFEEETLSLLCSKMKIVDVVKGTILFFKGDRADCAYLILKGRVSIFSLSPDGKKIFLNSLNEKDFFGELALLDRLTRTAGAEAATNCRIAVIEREKFLKLAQSFNSEEWLSVVRYITGLLRKATAIVEDKSFLKVNARIMKKLIELTPEGEKNYQINMTQQEFASSLGISREVVARTFSVMEKQGLISKKYRTIIVKDKAKLAKRVEGVV